MCKAIFSHLRILDSLRMPLHGVLCHLVFLHALSFDKVLCKCYKYLIRNKTDPPTISLVYYFV